MLSEKEQRVLKETRLRNLKRTLAKLSQHPDLTEEYSLIKKQITELENEIR